MFMSLGVYRVGKLQVDTRGLRSYGLREAADTPRSMCSEAHRGRYQTSVIPG